jgi:hypothetical protein
MTMMAFITHCLRKAQFDLIGLLACICLFWSVSGPVHAQAFVTEIAQLRFDRAGEAVLLSANVKFELPSAVEDALLKGVPVIFVAHVDVFRERWYWMNRRVLSVERHMRLSYHPLTRRWRLNVSAGQNTQTGLGVALNQNFETLSDALAALQRLSRWKIADVADLDLDQRHLVEFRFYLDVSQLPRPLQIGTVGQTDWDIALAARRPLVLESAK